MCFLKVTCSIMCCLSSSICMYSGVLFLHVAFCATNCYVSSRGCCLDDSVTCISFLFSVFGTVMLPCVSACSAGSLCMAVAPVDQYMVISHCLDQLSLSCSNRACMGRKENTCAKSGFHPQAPYHRGPKLWPNWPELAMACIQVT